MKTLVQKVKFKASPQELYDILLDPKKHSAATGAKATGNGKLGGSFTAWDGYIQGKTLALVPGRMIAQSWRSGEFRPKDHDSVLVLTFEVVRGGTLLTMTHTAVPDPKADDFAEGWRTHYWRPIQKHLGKK